MEGYHQGGWWEGFVFSTFDDHISIYFPETPNEPPENFKVHQKDIDRGDPEVKRVR